VPLVRGASYNIKFKGGRKMNDQEKIELANQIIKYLGGHKFVVMTGAKQIFALDNGVQFKIGRNVKSINKVKITLNGMDLFDMQFLSVKMTKDFDVKVKTIAEYNNVYFDQLENVFHNTTKLNTRLF
jgi:hypothetical protein